MGGVRGILKMLSTHFHKKVFKRRIGKKGSTLPAALFAILLFALSGTALLEMSASQHVTTGNEMNSIQALQIGTAGLEEAKYLLSLGSSPVVTDKPLGDGSYTIVTDPANGLVTVTSQVGLARKVQSINADFAGDCVVLDTSGAYTSGNDLYGVKLTKNCNDSMTLTKMWIDWNWSDCVLGSADPLNECPNDHLTDHDHGSASVSEISLDNQVIYDPSLGSGTPSIAADPAEEIDTADITLTTDRDYLFEGPSHPIRFSSQHPGRGLYTITLEFSDGSQSTATFQDQTKSLDEAVDVGVETDHGQVVVSQNHNVKLETICSEITYGRFGPRIPVTVELGVTTNGATSYSRLFNGAAVAGGEVYERDSGGGETYTVRARARHRFWRSTYDSTNTLQVKTLMNGELAPIIPGFGNQQSATDCLAPYLEGDGTVRLEGNQVIMLFELGVNLQWYPDSPAADFQDLVVLFTVTNSESTDSPPPPNDGCGEHPQCNQPGKFPICHVPPGNATAAHTLCVDAHGWENGHNGGHGIHQYDTLGPCPPMPR